MSKRIRQYIGILAAIIIYYIVHEGAHLLVALYYGVFIEFSRCIGTYSSAKFE